MSLIHDIIKIKYIYLGYLPNYPYHMISDREMFNAFIDLSSNDDSSDSSDDNYAQSANATTPHFFEDYYSNPFSADDFYNPSPNSGDTNLVSLSEAYYKLRTYIIDTINKYISDPETNTIPNWIYTYMLGEVVYTKSEYLDIYDTLALLGCNNIDNEFTVAACTQCYATSLKYISTLTSGIRPPTVFGEPHVIKQLRLMEV